MYARKVCWSQCALVTKSAKTAIVSYVVELLRVYYTILNEIGSLRKRFSMRVFLTFDIDLLDGLAIDAM